MHRATHQTGWVRNPDGAYGWICNPITGCLKGCEYCYARKRANGRLKSRYLANRLIAAPTDNEFKDGSPWDNPFHPRFWHDRLERLLAMTPEGKSMGVWLVDMGDIFGPWIPKEWHEEIFRVIEWRPWVTFYLLTKQYWELPRFSPFPSNCRVGVSATTFKQWQQASDSLRAIEANGKFVSFEPLFERIGIYPERLKYVGVDQVIIGAQTSPYLPPHPKDIQAIVEAADQAEVDVFLKDNLRPLFLAMRAGKVLEMENLWTSAQHSGRVMKDIELREEGPWKTATVE